MKYEFKDKLFLVTGGSGFLGKPLVGRLLKSGARVRIFARDEGKLLEAKQLYPSVEILTGDVSDEFEVKQAMVGVSGVFHLAASKHIGIAEKQVRECIKSTLSLHDTAIDNQWNSDETFHMIVDKIVEDFDMQYIFRS